MVKIRTGLLSRSGRRFMVGLALFFLAVAAVDVLADDPLRDSIERRMNAAADFLANPIPDLSANLTIHKLPLDRLEPIIENYRLSVRRGELSAEGNVLYGPENRRVTLDELRIDGIHIDYVNDPTLTRRAAVAEADRQQKTQILVRRLQLTRSELGFVNRKRNPDYRVFLTDLELTLDGWSNLPDADSSRLRARGSFMGSGRTAVQGAFRPDPEGADFELAVAIEDTRLAAMNDLLRAYANFDVTGGAFSFYSEIRVADGQIDGYVKPLFHGVEAYDPEQDREQNFFRRLWERLAEGVAEILENRPGRTWPPWRTSPVRSRIPTRAICRSF